MADIVDRATRSRMMAGIRGKDTKPELVVRSYLHRAGLRFRVHVRTLPGSPDIVFPRHGVAVFVHGCFWHRHAGCPYATTPRSNVEFWREKFATNVARDRRKIAALRRSAWRVIVVWECRIGDAALKRLVRRIVGSV